jgi:transcriptional regulator with XRE-family HTH domain
MPTTPTVRMRPSQAQREAILTAYRRSQLTQREFASQSGISVSALQLWLRKAAARPCTQTTGFVQVPNLLAPAPAPSVYRLHLPGAIDLEVGSGFRPEELASLLQLLRSL